MPLEDLESLGYTISRSPEGMPPFKSVYGFGRQWNLQPERDEEEVVTEARNHHAIWTKMSSAKQAFSDNYANWGTMTAGQKDAANRNAQRALANLIRHVQNDMASEGD